jgi:hypothetical protein
MLSYCPGTYEEVITCPHCASRMIFGPYKGSKYPEASGVWRWDHD